MCISCLTLVAPTGFGGVSRADQIRLEMSEHKANKGLQPSLKDRGDAINKILVHKKEENKCQLKGYLEEKDWESFLEVF